MLFLEHKNILKFYILAIFLFEKLGSICIIQSKIIFDLLIIGSVDTRLPVH